MYRLIRQAAASLAFISVAIPAAAATISLGTFLPSTTPFVVPVVVSDAVEFASFQFDLFYDPAQYSIHTSCDAFAGDVYCDFVTGPVTQGTFFSNSAMFPPLFNPGFILLDPSGTQQIGQLLGVEGAWQDPDAAPSGSGTLAFIEFVALVAQPTSPIVVRGPAVVPEPTTIALLFAGMAVLTTRRPSRRAAGTRVALA